MAKAFTGMLPFNKPSSQVEAKPLPSNGTITSEKAADERSATKTAMERLMILSVLQLSPNGLTDAQIQYETGIDQNAERPRRWQLVRDGLVKDSGLTRIWGAHKESTVWVLVSEPQQKGAA